ncbi:MAG: dephospho-CoA kinase [Verrucomicrobiota bacterium]|nr:dephospho-CoA kinase [Verrucomicrobiota bacterium]
MPLIGITGGIATGKSTFARGLLRELPAELFDSDRCAHELLANDTGVHEMLANVFGSAIFDERGRPDRARLRQQVFANPASRKLLEEILHPRIRARWRTWAAESAASKTWLFVDIPLLYETGAEAHLDRVLVVACAPATQRRRLRELRGLDEALAESILAAQADLRVKISKADHVIWNDSTLACLDRQAGLLAQVLRHRYD